MHKWVGYGKNCGKIDMLRNLSSLQTNQSLITFYFAGPFFITCLSVMLIGSIVIDNQSISQAA